MLELVCEARRAATVCAAAPAWAVPEGDLVGCLEQAWAAVQQLTAVTAHLVWQAQSRGVPQAHAATSTLVWLRQQLRVSPGAAARLVALAQALNARPVLDDAVCAGTMSAEQATTIADTIKDLPADLGREIIDKAEAALVDRATVLDPVRLGKVGARILEYVAPEVAEQREADLLAGQEAKAHRRRGFTLSPLGNGQVRLSGFLDASGAATVNAALDPLCHPRHDPAGARTPAQRRADALVDVCTGALREGSDLPGHGGDPAQVVVTVPFTTLTDPPANTAPAGGGATNGGQARGQARAGAGVGWLDTGAPISAAEARRLACDAHILPAVLNGQSQVLDLGRTRRLFTGPIRRALILRDRGCSFPNCDRPARWAEGHHLRSWADGGATDLTNACLVCRRHHRLLHNSSGWQARLDPDGHPEFLPPTSIDPERRPQRNTYHHRE